MRISIPISHLRLWKTCEVHYAKRWSNYRHWSKIWTSRMCITVYVCMIALKHTIAATLGGCERNHHDPLRYLWEVFAVTEWFFWQNHSKSSSGNLLKLPWGAQWNVKSVCVCVYVPIQTFLTVISLNLFYFFMHQSKVCLMPFSFAICVLNNIKLFQNKQLYFATFISLATDRLNIIQV